jgi:hypothetical protein
VGRTEEIEQLLIVELNHARMAYDIAAKALSEIVANTPSGLPLPDGVARIKRAASANESTMIAWMNALREFGDFILLGAVPDRFKNSGQISKLTRCRR